MFFLHFGSVFVEIPGNVEYDKAGPAISASIFTKGATMERKLPILDYRKCPSGRFVTEPASGLSANDFVEAVQCTVFDASGKLLLLPFSGSDDRVLYSGVNGFPGEDESADVFLSRMLSRLLGPHFKPEQLIFLRSLVRRNTVLDLYTLRLSVIHTELSLLPGFENALFVTESELEELKHKGLLLHSMCSAFHFPEMVGLHYKNIFRNGWPRVTEREYAWKYVKDNKLDGIVSLIAIKKVLEPNSKTMGGKRYVITDEGYYWFQYAPKDGRFWLTVMLDPSLSVIQYYIDITGCNEVFSDGSAYFFDLYLDIVMLPDGELFVLDADELNEALHSGSITREMHDRAWKTCNEIKAFLTGREPILRAFCLEYAGELMKKTERD